MLLPMSNTRCWQRIILYNLDQGNQMTLDSFFVHPKGWCIFAVTTNILSNTSWNKLMAIICLFSRQYLKPAFIFICSLFLWPTVVILKVSFICCPNPQMSSPGGSVVKNLPANAGDLGSIPGWGRSPGEGNGNPLQYSCLENPMDRGALQAIVHGVAKSYTQLSD